MTVAGIALLPERFPVLGDVLHHILPNVDALYYVIDGPDDPPKWLVDLQKANQIVPARRLGDAGKFAGLSAAQDAYYLSLDDDLLYPSHYVKGMVQAVDRYERQALVSFVGHVAKAPCTSYYRDGRMVSYRFDSFVPRDERINIPGTGGCAFWTGTVNPKLKDFKTPNMADIWLGIWCNERKIPQRVVAHSTDFVRHAPIDFSKTIYETHKKDDKPMTKAVNRHKWTLP